MQRQLNDRTSGQLTTCTPVSRLTENDISLSVIPTNSSDYDIQTSDTIVLMQRIATTQSKEPLVIKAVGNAFKKLPATATRFQKIKAIFDWIKQNIRFVDDPKLCSVLFPKELRNPNGEDLLITPRLLLSLGDKRGDCDDFSMLAAAMLISQGFTVRFRTVAGDYQFPNLFSHVYLIVLNSDNGQWVPFDASHGNYLGWQYPYATRVRDWVIN